MTKPTTNARAFLPIYWDLDENTAAFLIEIVGMTAAMWLDVGPIWLPSFGEGDDDDQVPDRLTGMCEVSTGQMISTALCAHGVGVRRLEDVITQALGMNYDVEAGAAVLEALADAIRHSPELRRSLLNPGDPYPAPSAAVAGLCSGATVDVPLVGDQAPTAEEGLNKLLKAITAERIKGRCSDELHAIAANVAEETGYED